MLPVPLPPSPRVRRKVRSWSCVGRVRIGIKIIPVAPGFAARGGCQALLVGLEAAIASRRIAIAQDAERGLLRVGGCRSQTYRRQGTGGGQRQDKFAHHALPSRTESRAEFGAFRTIAPDRRKHTRSVLLRDLSLLQPEGNASSRLQSPTPWALPGGSHSSA